ncbi:ABC transporter substrate-binding protein [Clostridium hydrogeniformans]|uniref:ABC transporter substrate-binding protein n=1 Tax=Clostridium hydrogeniformans TaxID=349933 RepID=UPI000489AB4F|nr:spermidine/putrescine ABC transporter substrate-binding protein [Clostridium hydrogeniformans]
MKKTFKLLGIICVIIIFTFSFMACNKKQTLQVFNWGENIDEDLIKEFEDKYDIKITYSTYDTNEDMYLSVKSGKTNYDVVVPSDYMVQKMVRENLLEEINFNNIPNFKEIDESFLGRPFDPENKYSVPYMSGTIGILYNKDIIKEPVDSWNILWNEKYKKQMFILDAQRDAIGMALKRLGYSLNTTNEEELKKAKEELIKQKPLVLAYVQDEVKDRMIAGDGALAVIWSGEGLNLQDEHPNLQYVVPKEGANFWVDSLSIPKGAKNKKEAELFINFMCEKDSALRNASLVGYTTPHKEAQKSQPESIRNNRNAYLPKEILDKCENYEDLGDKLKLYDEVWTEVKVNN